MTQTKLIVLAFVLAALTAVTAPGATSPNTPPADLIARLCNEGTNRSHIAEIFGYLTDVIGPRLTGSPNCRRANDWTRDQLVSWGLTNASLEAWGPFGRGWSVKRFSAQVVEPQGIPLVAWPKAWSCGSEWTIFGEVVYLDAKNEADYDKYLGKLKGCIVLISTPRDIPIHFEPMGTRQSDSDLLRLANAATPDRSGPRRRGRPGRKPAFPNSPSARAVKSPPAPTATNAPAPPPKTNEVRAAVSTNAPVPPPKTNEVRAAAITNQPPPRVRRGGDSGGHLGFAVREGAALTVSISGSGDGGVVSVGDATVVFPSEGTNPAPSGVSAYATNAPAGPPQIVVADEQYNRIVHMIQAGEKVKMAVEVQTQFYDRDLMGYNTLAEIPGTDLKDEIVMLGAHLDSAPGGTGATDNAAGVAVCMEAVRLIKALHLQPRQTIRIGLWTGEEQGLYGSKAYVSRHFGYYTNQTSSARTRAPRDNRPAPASTNAPAKPPQLVQKHDYRHFSAYYNLDNGAGRIRGVYLQGNDAVRPLFRLWLDPFRDLGAATLTPENTGGTDHLSFDEVGLPGFQFIQDAVEYGRSYHTSIDVRERAPIADLQQASIIMAAFVYNTAMLGEKLPRKPVEKEPVRRP